MSVLKNPQGPVWPLGLIVVSTPGTAVGVMSLVDSGSVNDPNTATSSTSAEYPPVFYSLTFQGVKAGGGGLVNNAGNVYVVHRGGNRGDGGTILAMIAPGTQFTLLITPGTRRNFNGYNLAIDADTAADACLVVGYIQ